MAERAKQKPQHDARNHPVYWFAVLDAARERRDRRPLPLPLSDCAILV